MSGSRLEDGWLTLPWFHAEVRERVTELWGNPCVMYSCYSAMERIYLQRQWMGGNPCTRPASGTVLNVLQSFWNMEQVLMLQVKEASNYGFEESKATFRWWLFLYIMKCVITEQCMCLSVHLFTVHHERQSDIGDSWSRWESPYTLVGFWQSKKYLLLTQWLILRLYKYLLLTSEVI